MVLLGVVIGKCEMPSTNISQENGHAIIISNTMVFKNIVIKSPANRGRFVKVPRESLRAKPEGVPRDFHKPPRFAGDLITIFLKTMVLVCNTMMTEVRLVFSLYKIN